MPTIDDLHMQGSGAYPQELVRPAFVPLARKAGGVAHLVRTWLLELEKRDIHTYMHACMEAYSGCVPGKLESTQVPDKD